MNEYIIDCNIDAINNVIIDSYASFRAIHSGTDIIIIFLTLEYIMSCTYVCSIYISRLYFDK
jgi:hypothetical protein